MKNINEAIAPTNSAGAGHVRGVADGDAPVFRKKSRKKDKRKKIKKFSAFVSEAKSDEPDPITWKDLKDVERFADRLGAQYGLDIEFNNHFKDRVNDKRNGKPVTVEELMDFFKDALSKKGKKIGNQNSGFEAVLTKLTTGLNLPFVVKGKRGDMEFVAKTIMRKKNFKTPDKKLPI